ncbi:coatomer subunit zeta-1 isoform X2 [Diabrotica virgifera virgifera]|uniref:Coatomer subunit zeta n=1 Tax=Diabrotica virgifera virgifera TaxID=50390 RepID=A0A6P7F7R1_DIAVI|nr:coatomer subunit zeta-1 isoform X2 [Diabrotica virgifera virgifera]
MEGMQWEPTLYTVKGILIMDCIGERVLAKYYDKNLFITSKEQSAFEKTLFNKTYKEVGGEIINVNGLTCVYKSNVELLFYVIGSSQENELMLVSVLNCLYDTINQILKKNMERKALLDQLDIVMLAVDEICDEGIMMGADSNSVISRIALRNDDLQIGEQTVAQVFQSAKEQLKWSFLK